MAIFNLLSNAAASDLVEMKRKAGPGALRDWKEMVRKNNQNNIVNDDDVLAEESESLDVLKELVEEKKSLADVDQRGEGEGAQAAGTKNRWYFENSPHAQFGKTLDDTYRAFLAWARVREGFGKEEDYGKINVSRALRRLESYADFIRDNDEVFAPSSLEAETIQARVSKWAFRTSVDAEGRLVWWIDTDRLNPHDLSENDYLQTIAWYAHAVMYHEAALKNGVVFVLNINHIGVSKALTIFPAKLGSHVTRMVLGVIPIQCKSLVWVECPRWVNFFFWIMLGLSKKFKEVLLFFDDWNDVLDWSGGLEGIPKGQ
ncbi:hypothetical protein ACHAWF_006134 [Thalassiosira exigua]